MFNKQRHHNLYSYFTNYENTFIKKVIFCGFILIFTTLITDHFLKQRFSNYVYSEWLINYAGGFVRRGLTGTIIFGVREFFNFNNDQMFFMVVSVNYVIFLIFAGNYIFKVNQSFKLLTLETLMIFLFLPSLILFPINDINGLGRKDYLFLLGLLMHLWLVSRTVNFLDLHQPNEEKQKLNSQNINRYSYQVFIFYNLFSIFCALSHEALLFLVLPLNFIITTNLLRLNYSPRKTIVNTLIIYSPTIFICVISMIVKGNEEIALKICESWLQYNFPTDANCQKLPLVLSFYDYSTSEAILQNFKINILRDNGLRFFSWITSFLLSIIILMRASETTISKTVEAENRRLCINNKSLSFSPQKISISFSFKYLLLPFICSFILYIIAFDWGRWFMIICITYALCLLTPSLIKLEMYSYEKNKYWLDIIKPIFKVYSQIISFFQTKFNIKKYYFGYFVIFIYTLFFLRILHYGMNIDNLSHSLIIDSVIRLVKKFLVLF